MPVPSQGYYGFHSFPVVDWFCLFTDFPKPAEKLSVIRTDRHENLVRPKNILPVRKKSPKKFTVTSDFPKLAEKLSVIRTDRHENLVRPKNILLVRKKSPKKFIVTCIMFSLAFLEWFTLVLAIGHLISPLVFIEVKVIHFSVLFKIVYVMSFIVCLEFCCFYDLIL
jgi:hypothetical protein